VKGAKSKGVRLGNWLLLRQAQALMNAPDATAKKGTPRPRDASHFAWCGLRRSEVPWLGHIQKRDNASASSYLSGKHGRVRTIPIPTWVKGAIDAWTSVAGFTAGQVLRPVSRGDQVKGVGRSEKVVWQLFQQCAAAAGVPGAAPHDTGFDASAERSSGWPFRRIARRRPLNWEITLREVPRLRPGPGIV
jgi:integrase